jgi:hypothetical protein
MLSYNVITLSRWRSCWGIINLPLWLVYICGLLQLDATLLSISMTAVISIIAIEGVASCLVLDGWAIRRRWSRAVVRLIWVILSILSALSILAEAVSWHPRCSIHGWGSSATTAAVVDTSKLTLEL